MGIVVAAAVAVLLAVAPSIAEAGPRYVDAETGSDGGGNTCESGPSPCATITYAASQAAFADTIIIDDGDYNENVVLSNGQSLVGTNFDFSDVGPVVIDGGAGVAVTVSAPGGGEIRGFTLRSNTDVVTLAGPTWVSDNVFDDPDATTGTMLTLSPGAMQSEVFDNHFEDPNPSTTRGRIGIFAVAEGVRIADNTFAGLNLAIQSSGIGESLTIVEGNTITGTHNLPFAGRAILAENNTLIRENTIRDPFDGAPNGIDVTSGVRLERNLIAGHLRGVFVHSDSTGITLNGDLIVGNMQYGIWAFDNNPTPTRTSLSMTNVTIIDNLASDIYGDNSILTIDSSIVGTIFGNPATTCEITFSRANDITADPTGCHDFSTTADPGFVNRAGGDYHLLATSPLIDMGNPAAPDEGMTDRDDDPRAVDGSPECDTPEPRRDIGYDEVVPTVEVDCTPPNTRLSKKPKKKVTKKKAAFKLSSTEPGSTFQCKIDKKPWKPCAATVKFNVKVGKHTFQARATDSAGNTDASPVKYKFKRLKK